MAAVGGRRRARDRGENDGAVDMNIMEKSVKSQGNELSDLDKVRLHQHLSIPTSHVISFSFSYLCMNVVFQLNHSRSSKHPETGTAQPGY